MIPLWPMSVVTPMTNESEASGIAKGRLKEERTRLGGDAVETAVRRASEIQADCND